MPGCGRTYGPGGAERTQKTLRRGRKELSSNTNDSDRSRGKIKMACMRYSAMTTVARVSL